MLVLFNLTGDREEDGDPIVLPVESTILDEPLTLTSNPINTWQAYYSERGFRLDSPIAILLQWPLTLYYVIKYCLPNDSECLTVCFNQCTVCFAFFACCIDLLLL